MPIKKITRVFFMLCLMALTIISASAQDNSNTEGWYYGKEIRKIDFKGLTNVSSLELEGVVSPYVGQKFSDNLYADLLNKMYGLEFFDEITPRALPADPERKTIVLEFTVVERPIISSIIFQGNNKIRDRELADEITTKATDVYIASSVLLAERKIRDLYLRKGYTHVTVTSKTEAVGDTIRVVFIINEGKATVITSIEFQGNKNITSRTLAKELSLKELSLFNKGAFQESALNIDKNNLLMYYSDRGYIHAEITDIVRDINHNQKENRDEMILTFKIYEGDAYTYGGTTLEGNTIYTTEELLSFIRVKEGDVINMSLFQQGLSAIADMYYEDGYTSNIFNPQIKTDSVNYIVSCDFSIIENPQSHIGNVIVQGNKKTKDYVIRREIPLENGDIFSKTKVQTGLRSLYNLQYFSAIVPDVVPSSKENTVDLIINVEEQSTTSIEFGITFSGASDPDSWPISAFAKWQDSNFSGTGQTIHSSLTISTETQSLGLGYANSWLFNKPIDFSANLNFNRKASTALQYMYLPDGVNKTDYYMEYNELILGGSLALGKRWVQDLGTCTLVGGVSVDCKQNFYDSDLFEPVDKTISADNGRWGLENSIWTKLAFDGRDISYDPSKGWFASQQFSWTGLIPQIENQYYLRTDTKGELYFTLLDLPVSSSWNLKFVLAGYSGLSLVIPQKDSLLSDTSKLYIDGMFNGRGWNLYADRGNALWSNYIELRMPIATGVFAVDFFADAIVLADTPTTLFNNIGVEDWRFSYGPGIRFSLPQFPLRLLLANSFRVENGTVVWDDGIAENTGKPQWKFVLSFCLTNK
ncbi:MAG TPA: outer membrane protein assembly factor BamA [Treponemataceae bacterium]|nr:outer membrane protein assembly factor BamA [Treponemataceae bacterium]